MHILVAYAGYHIIVRRKNHGSHELLTYNRVIETLSTDKYQLTLPMSSRGNPFLPKKRVDPFLFGNLIVCFRFLSMDLGR